MNANLHFTRLVHVDNINVSPVLAGYGLDPQMTSRYCGSCKIDENGRYIPHGSGRIRFAPYYQDTYEGHIINGLAQGFGKLSRNVNGNLIIQEGFFYSGNPWGAMKNITMQNHEIIDTQYVTYINPYIYYDMTKKWYKNQIRTPEHPEVHPNPHNIIPQFVTKGKVPDKNKSYWMREM